MAGESSGGSGGDEPIVVDLHCHSDSSDGYYSPGEVAGFAADAGVRFAALTDHHTTDGLAAFHEVAARRGVVEFAGAEIHALVDAVEIHLLAYGFDPGSASMQELYATVSDADRAIELIHRSAGIAVLAHPLTGRDRESVDALVARLAGAGLDGIEAYYKPYPVEDRELLVELADRYGLLVTGGSDFHGPRRDETSRPGIEIPVARWKRFREALGDHARNGNHAPAAPRRVEDVVYAPRNWPWLIARIVLPAVLVIAFFVTLIFGYLIPTMERGLLDRKREMTAELANSAWSILRDYQQDAATGVLSEQEAKELAIERIRRLRYGPDGLDYFWITDTHPRMVMHPYRPDLEGNDLSDFTDPDGIRPFVGFVDAVRSEPSGYVTYVWQWQDDPERLEPKESYVRRFDPWGWIIGTGIYVDDVNREIRAVTGRIVDVSFLVTIVAVALLTAVAYQALRAERQRGDAERELRVSHERYRALVESSTGGTLLLVDGRCTYANASVLDMLGYTAAELAFLDVHDIVVADGDEDRAQLSKMIDGEEVRDAIELPIRRRDGSMVLALLSSSAVFFSGEKGVILTVAHVTRHQQLRDELGESQAKYEALAERISSGVFRAAMDDDMTIFELNDAARRMFGVEGREPASVSLRAAIATPQAFDGFASRLRADGAVRDTVLQIRRRDGASAIVNLSAVVSDSRVAKHGVCAAIMEDISERRRTELDRESTISQLQTSLLFLTEPVRSYAYDPLMCPLHTPIAQAVRAMSRAGSDAMLVVQEDRELVGIVTDQDIRNRVVAGDADTRAPVSRIMSAPVITVSDSAPLFEAFLLEREHDIDHLAVVDSSGKTVGIIRGSRAVRLERYSLVVLLHEIRRADTIDTLSGCHERLHALVRSLVTSGARPQNISHITTTVSDAIVEQVIRLVIDELGPPPARFAFLALGSEARREQTLATDQDNALVFEDDASTSRDAMTYFQKLGELVCDALDAVGYHHCRGGTMAKNPAWNQPLSAWKRSFSRWIAEPDGQAVANCNIFFDQRCVHGDRSLTADLWRHVDAQIDAHPAFLTFMARGTVQYKPPVGLFGKIVTGSSGAEANAFDIKAAMTPLSNIARLYSLEHHLAETNTLDRFEQLHTLAVLSDESFRSLTEAFGHLMQLRLRAQLASIESGRPADNLVDPRSLTQLELGTLRHAFAQITAIQKRVAHEFHLSA